MPVVGLFGGCIDRRHSRSRGGSVVLPDDLDDLCALAAHAAEVEVRGLADAWGQSKQDLAFVMANRQTVTRSAGFAIVSIGEARRYWARARWRG